MAYDPEFLTDLIVPLPRINKSVHPNLAPLLSDPRKTVIDFDHHSVVLNRDRRLAVLSACNIDGDYMPEGIVPRRTGFKLMPDVNPLHQLGSSFYKQCGYILDKGHLTKYEDVIWGKDLTDEAYMLLGKTTNFYPNAVPQHRRMNRGLWSSLELYILDTETEMHDLKVCMFTGPVLNPKDPFFIHPVDDKPVQLPLHFWKIVVYKRNNKLYALGFMMSHKTLLEKTELTRQVRLRLPVRKGEEIFFNDFKHSGPYQVMVEHIESLAGIDLKASVEIQKPFKKERPLELLYREIDVRNKMLMSRLGRKRFLTSYRLTNIIAA